MDLERRAAYDRRLDEQRARNVSDGVTSADIVERINEGTASPEEIERFTEQVAARVAHDFN